VIGLVGTMQLAALAALGFTAVGALGAAVLYPAWRRQRLTTSPAARARGLLAWAAAPAVFALLMTSICFLPSVLGVVGAHADHCARHDDHHPHLCLVHHPANAGSAAGWTILVVVGGVLFLSSGRRLRQLWHTRRLLGALGAVGRWDVTHGVRWVDTAAPLSVVAGLWGGEIIVSSSLARSLPANLLQVVVEHERAHVKRRDALRRVVAQLLCVAHVPAVRARLLADLSVACEQACDEEAARRVGDRLRVAHAIVSVERMFGAHGAGLGMLAPAFSGTDVVARVERLVNPPCDVSPSALRVSWLLVAGVAAAIAVADPLHHVTETALGLLAR